MQIRLFVKVLPRLTYLNTIMGRWRPPKPKALPYITPEGYEALKDELDSLWLRRREVTAHLAAAAAEGDRSENAEYIYRKKELRGLDSRIRYIQQRLPALKIVSELPSDTNFIFFGARVVLSDEQGQLSTIRIVGADEFSPEKNLISIDSPLAQALLKKGIDDEVSVQTPEGEKHYSVIEIKYRPST